MNPQEFTSSLAQAEPPTGLSVPLAALWWDAKGHWTRSHALVDELETADGMAVHAYLHRKEGQVSNAEYWYERAGRRLHRPALEAEWQALVEALLSGALRRVPRSMAPAEKNLDACRTDTRLSAAFALNNRKTNNQQTDNPAHSIPNSLASAFHFSLHGLVVIQQVLGSQSHLGFEAPDRLAGSPKGVSFSSLDVHLEEQTFSAPLWGIRRKVYRSHQKLSINVATAEVTGITFAPRKPRFTVNSGNRRFNQPQARSKASQLPFSDSEVRRIGFISNQACARVMQPGNKGKQPYVTSTIDDYIGSEWNKR